LSNNFHLKLQKQVYKFFTQFFTQSGSEVPFFSSLQKKNCKNENNPLICQVETVIRYG